ncbi:MAG: hypothetical protein ACTH5M_03805 [Psychrobacter sp.]|uniref:hypothetical protein n=1 Tax=Psychrobacter sp. AOP7-B1-24 TaxID=3457645 RepID=UPI003FB90CA5
MKKILLSLAISWITLSALPVMAAVPAFSAGKIAQVKIKDLSFKEVMRKFYNGQMFDIHVDYMENTPYIGLGKYDDSGRATIALMLPVIQYKNTAGEDRYLIIVEKVQVSDGEVDSCHICGATADLYSFKKLNNGLFQLVSQTPKDVKYSGSNGSSGLYAEDIQEGMQPLGKNLVGSLFTNFYMGQGARDDWWKALHLPENDFINVYYVGDAGSSNERYDEDSPLYYGYEGTLKVLPNNTTYYPIMLTYKGEMPTDDERIEHVNYSKIVKFNPTKKAYE